MRVHSFRLFLTIIFGIAFLAGIGCGKSSQEGTRTGTTLEAQSSISEMPSKLSAAGMAELSSEDIALRVDDFTVTWGEFHLFLSECGISRAAQKNVGAVLETVNGLDQRQQEFAKTITKGVLQSRILLNQAKASKVSITQRDREELTGLWLQAHAGQSIEDFQKQFPVVPSQRLRLSREEYFVLSKYLEELFRQVQIPEETLRAEQAKFAKVRASFEARCAENLAEFQGLSARDGFQTDEGFAALAREYSEGMESDNGGEIADWLSRSEIAEVTGSDSFVVAVGESSTLLESPTAYRYVRVLQEKPGEMAGEPNQLKIAQILMMKKEIDGIPTEEELEKRLRYEAEKSYTTQLLLPILNSDGRFACPLFPRIREDWTK